MLYVGLDVHSRTSSMCILDGRGKELATRKIAGPWKHTLAALDQIKEPFAVCFEASCGYGYLYERLRENPRAQKVVVGHPGQMRMIFKSKKKHDRIDAQKIAKLLYLDVVPQVYVPSAEVRSWRALIEFRRKLLAKRVATKNQLRALLRSSGRVAPRGLWTKQGLAWLKEQVFETLAEGVRRDMLLEELGEQTRRIRQVEKSLNQEAARHPAVALLRTIPGVGPRTAEAVVAYIDQPMRFGKLKAVGSYFGLVPCQDASAEKNRLGHITKDGPASVRQLLVEAAWQGINRCPEIREHFEKLVGGDPDRRKIALVGTARWLLTIMLAMLKTGEACRFVRQKKTRVGLPAQEAPGPAASHAGDMTQRLAERPPAA